MANWKERLAEKIGGAVAKALTPKVVDVAVKGNGDRKATRDDDGNIINESIELDIKVRIEVEY